MRMGSFFIDITNHSEHVIQYLQSNYFLLGTYTYPLDLLYEWYYPYLIGTSMILTNQPRATKGKLSAQFTLSRPVWDLRSFHPLVSHNTNDSSHSPGLACMFHVVPRGSLFMVTTAPVREYSQPHFIAQGFTPKQADSKVTLE